MPPNDAPRLDWASKPKTVERVSLPFQVVETINESRATREAHRGSLFGRVANSNGCQLLEDQGDVVDLEVLAHDTGVLRAR